MFVALISVYSVNFPTTYLSSDKLMMFGQYIIRGKCVLKIHFVTSPSLILQLRLYRDGPEHGVLL